ncbi:DUF2510 domain-containing protein [Actinoplanes utahensis]|uniref:DUF2510 domain-containing protein n=1 Tax=Actinoplanes utahensis TaxID=1869 RepID=A0A0A6WYY4_ACTUT|nr:DUF2510 domain-containing protein [Actinoplanes utahensis]KHD72982.1 hypothetical protein MB27_36965 [Actinoplanes utahensis]GIF35170.1 hypothetical protein Aut01nite_81560 [Actinoplanes utahensis]
MTQPAGWYADPSGLPAQRWWDGRQWTDHIQPGGTPTPPPNGYFPPIPPSGPAAPGPHTVVPDNNPPLYVTQHAGPPVARPFTLTSPSPGAPTGPSTMHPVDAVPGRLGFTTPPRPAPDTPGAPDASDASDASRKSVIWRAAGPVALAVIAALILALTAFLLLR